MMCCRKLQHCGYLFYDFFFHLFLRMAPKLNHGKAVSLEGPTCINSKSNWQWK